MSLFGSTSAAKPTAFTFPSTTSTAPATSTPSLFGSTTPSKPLFGSTTQASSTPSLFGSTTTTSTPSRGLFGGTTATATSSTGGSLFGGTTTTSTTPSLFGSTGTSTFGSSTGGSLFSSKPATTGLFGSASNQQQQQQISSQQQVIQSYHPFVRAVGHPQITGTDDDRHIANLNQVAAALGIGKAPYKDGNQIQTFNMEGNLFAKFVGIGYNKISERTDDEGVVSMVLKHSLQEMSNPEMKTKILEAITNILGNQQNLKVVYAPGTSFRSLSDGFTEICVIVKEGGFIVPAIKFAQVLNDAGKLSQLESQLHVDKTRVLPKVGMSKAQIKRYLETVPDGVDEKIWRQAIDENPAPSRMLPVVVRGWEELRDRQRAQVAEAQIYSNALVALGKKIEKAQTDAAKALADMEVLRSRRRSISQRIARIILKLWISQRNGRQIDSDEDVLEARCDTLLAKLTRPNQINHWVSAFDDILKKKYGKLEEGALKAYDMSEDDQIYARKFLTEILLIGEQLVEKTLMQMEDIEAIRRTLNGE